MFQRDPLKNIRDVFAAVGPRFEVLVNLFPLDHGNRIGFFFKEGGYRIAGNSVGLVFQAIHPHAAFFQLRMREPQSIHALPTATEA